MSASRKLKRILLTADAVGGVWQFAASLTRALIQDGVSVAVATMGPRPSVSQLAELPPSIELFQSDFGLEWSHDPWSDVDAAGEWLLSLARQFRPDIVHLSGYAHAALGWNVPAVIVAHSCVLSWWRSVHGGEVPVEWNQYRHRVQAGLEACDSIVAPSAFMAAEIAGIYNIERRKISVIYNCISASALTVPRTKEPFCFAAGRLWDQAKNLTLLNSIAGHIEIPIYLAGGAAGSSSSALHLLGQLPHSEVLAYLSRARFFAHPALYEPFGLATLEAARARCCLLLADIATARELWDGAALFINPHSPDEWIAAFHRLAADPEECERLATAAYNRSLCFSEELFAARYRQLYSTLLNAQRAAA